MKTKKDTDPKYIFPGLTKIIIKIKDTIYTMLALISYVFLSDKNNIE